MSDTQTYDIIVLATSIALVAVILFWSVRFGVDMVASALSQSPFVIQQSIASYISALCSVSGDASISYSLPKSPSYDINIDATAVSVASRQDPTFGRSGIIKFKPPLPSPYPDCGLIVKVKKLSLTSASKFIEVEKTGKAVEVFVR